MRILLIHNRYKRYGGEDTTFECEKAILERNYHVVKTLIFENRDIEGFAAKLRTGYQLIYNRESARTTEEVVKAFKPDVIHVYNLFYVASPSIFSAAKKMKVPVVVTLQNYRLICSGALLMRSLKPCELCTSKIFPFAGIRYKCHHDSMIETAHLTFVTGIHKLLGTWNSNVSKYIAVTEFARDKFINSSLKLNPDKVVVKPSSVPTIAHSGFEGREDFFLFVGRLSPEKGVDTLLKAFEHASVTLEIVGDGPMRESVEKAANGAIRYAGYKDKTFILSRLRKCRALIVPSVWYECLPSTILEAYSTGTPVIISDIGNLNEIVSNGYNGVHFKPNDAEDLSRVVKHFAENPTEYEAMYENARQTYLAKYSPETNYRNLISIYESVINSYKK